MAELSKADSDTEDAIRYWGQLYKRPGIGPTPKLISLLHGLAKCISDTFHDADCEDLMPKQLLRFYDSVNGDYSHLFGLPPKSLAFIYQKLCCRYSLQPDPESDDFVVPAIPALKPQEGGFGKFFFVQLMLDPSAHWLFLQNALKKYDVRDIKTGDAFPKLLPRQLFPREPLPEMVGWHQQVSNDLYKEAQGHTRSRHDEEEDTEDSFTKLKDTAARYFSNPHSGTQDARPAIVRHLSKGAAMAYSFVKDVVDPNLFGGPSRRHSVQEKARKHDSATSEEYRRYDSARHTARHDQRRREEEIGESADSEAEYQARKSMRSARRHRSHEPLMSPRMYAQDHVDQRRTHRQSSRHAKENLQDQEFETTQSPPFVTSVNRVQHQPIRPRPETKGYFDLPQPSKATPGRFTQSPESSPLEIAVQSNSPYTPPVMAAPPPPPSAKSTYGHAVGRPEARRQSTPVIGVHGRKYPTDGVPWRKR